MVDVASEVDLVARVLGNRSWAAAQALIERYGSVRGLSRADVVEVGKVPGVGAVRAQRLAAALTLGRRVLEQLPERGAVVADANAAFAWLGPPLTALAVEELHALYLDRRSRPISHRKLTRGSDAYTVVDPRQVFRLALAVEASAVVLAHNHPSGDPTPSPQDREVTRRVAAAGRTLGVELVDHLVIASEGWVSMRGTGDLVVSEHVRMDWIA